MDYVDILMPLKEGRFIPQDVLNGLIRQNIPFRLWVSTAASDGDYAKARNNIKQYAHSSLYALMLDNDVVLPIGSLNLMIKFLDENRDFAAIAILKDLEESKELPDQLLTDEPEHVGMSCALFRTDELSKLTFGYFGGNFLSRQGCECLKACQDIRNTGKRIGIIRDLTARHIFVTEVLHLAQT